MLCSIQYEISLSSNTSYNEYTIFVSFCILNLAAISQHYVSFQTCVFKFNILTIVNNILEKSSQDSFSIEKTRHALYKTDTYV